MLGERFDADLLAAAAGVSEEAALQALGRLREAGLVADTRVAADARLAFRHALTRQAVLGGLLAPERQRRHARVLEIAGGTGGVRALPLDEALEHALGAGDRVRGLQFSIRAAGRAVELGGYAEARAHYERALALWDAQDGLPTRADLLMRLGYLTSHVGGGFLLWMQGRQSRQYFDEARRLFEEIGDAASATLAAAGAIWSRRTTDVLDELRAAREGLGADAPPEAVCQILCRLGDREFLVGRSRAALRTCAEGLALLEAPAAARDPAQFPRRVQLRRSFELTSAAATWWLGDRPAGSATMLALVDDALAEGDHLLATLTFNYLTRQSSDRPLEAAAYAERGAELAARHGLASSVAWLDHLRAQAWVHLGRWDDAEALLGRAEAILVEVPDQPFVLDALRMVRSELLLARGEIDEAAAVLGPLAAELDGRHGRIFRRIVRVALARARVSSGDPAGAAEALAPVVALWDREEEGPFALSALLPMAGVEVASALCDADGAARWCAELAALGSGPRADYARALVSLSGGAAESCELLERAACAVEDAGRRWEGAWMRLAGARAAQRAGDADGAADLAGRRSTASASSTATAGAARARRSCAGSAGASPAGAPLADPAV